MDVHDRSSDPWVLEIMEYWQSVLDEAMERKGQSVSYYLLPDQLIPKHLKSVELSRQAIAMGAELSPLELNWSISLLPPPYLPCEQRITDLEPMFIKDMKLETHHRGRRVLVRVLTPGLRTLGDMAVVEDEHGTAVTLHACHQPANVYAQDFMQTGDVFLLKEPFLVRELAEETDEYWDYRLRVDHLCDIVKLTVVDEMIPEKWRRTLDATSKVLRAQGNEAAKKKKWAEALRLYTSAIEAAGEDPEDRRLAHLNRSLVNLHLGRAEHARTDAKHGSNISPPPEKGLYRESLALYELGDFVRSLECLERILVSSPDHATTKEAIERVQVRLREQREGVYDFTEMYKQSKQTPPLIDCATYSVPVEVRPSPGRGNGLFTKVAVSAGQLLLCEKAFVYKYASPNVQGSMKILLNMATKKATDGGRAALLSALIQKLHYGSQQMRQSFGELCRGDFAEPAVSDVDGTPVVDSFLVDNITTLNCFGAPRSSLDLSNISLIEFLGEDEECEFVALDKFNNCGLWLLASRINHSCIGNCQRAFIGDMQIIRATRDLEAGSELLFPYRLPKNGDSYNVVQKALRSRWGITCSCELCESLKKTSRRALAYREALSGKVYNMISKNRDDSDIKHLLKEMERTYPPGAIAPQLWKSTFRHAEDFLRRDVAAECIETIAKGLRALGFDIEAVTPGRRKKPLLNVKRWGYAHNLTAWAFSRLFVAYKQVAPEVCGAAKHYAGVAHSMMMGEDVTLCKEHEVLA